jgi:maltose O-acetyltransferase
MNDLPVVDARNMSRPVAQRRLRLIKVRQLLREEFGTIHPRLWLIAMLLAPLPAFAGCRLRVYALRMIGFCIGYGTLMYGTPRITGSGDLYRRLTIGQFCKFNIGCLFDLEGEIRIGDRVGVGHEVMILTSTHEIGPREERADPALVRKPVVIEDGVWIGARCTILPGVTIGAGSVISAGMVVSRDVPPDTLVTEKKQISLARWRMTAAADVPREP